MHRPWVVGAAFALCLVVLVGAASWITSVTLELEQDEAAQRVRANNEENIRLALWRMDSSVGALIAQESARPYFVYSAFYAAQGAYTRMFAALEPGEVQVASPLLAVDLPHVLLHYQVDDGGRVTSPQVPDRADAAAGLVDAPRLELARRRLLTLRQLVQVEKLRAKFPPTADLIELEPLASANTEVEQEFPQQQNGMYQQSQRKSSMEWRARAMNVKSFYLNSQAPQMPQVVPARAVKAAAVAEGPVGPVWMGGELLLARGVSVGGRRYVQGCWINWPRLRDDLLKAVADIAPNAKLEPLPHADEPRKVDPNEPTRRLAAIPAMLVPGRFEAEYVPLPSRLPLIAAWGSVVLAALSVGALLLGVVSLSERRATFVSAVTHELRTPLTTFRLYTDLLAGGMVKDETKKAEYLETLKREAERLGHLVENVLAYARLERGRSGRRLEPIVLKDAIERCRPRLEERAKGAAFALELDLGPKVAGLTVTTDPAALDQILFNLVDNACKYGAGAEKRITLAGARVGNDVILSVRDRGPGISRREARALFVPFSRSAQEAAGSAPGVGLGLALSRQLARQLGGDLRLEDAQPGARFVLSLPV
jgi:signal transduction histidine kinase